MPGASEWAIALLMISVGVGALVLWIWALVDAIRVPDDAMYRVGTKLVWVLVILLAGILGAVLYLILARPTAAARRAPTAAPAPPPPPPPD
jgi:hypothetical protein